MDSYLFCIGVLFFGTLAACSAQLLLKAAAVREYPSLLRSYLNLRVAAGYIIMLLSTAASLMAFRILPLSHAPLADAAAQIFTAALSVLVLKEKLTKKRIAGLLIVVAGILIIAL